MINSKSKCIQSKAMLYQPNNVLEIPMHAQHEATAHSLYVLYQALSDESKQLFVKELLGEQKETLMLSLKNDQLRPSQANRDGNHFADICGILTATKTVSLEEMEQAISQQGLDGFDDSH